MGEGIHSTRQGGLVDIEGGWGGIDDFGEGSFFRIRTVMFIIVVLYVSCLVCLHVPGTEDGN